MSVEVGKKAVKGNKRGKKNLGRFYGLVVHLEKFYGREQGYVFGLFNSDADLYE